VRFEESVCVTPLFTVTATSDLRCTGDGGMKPDLRTLIHTPSVRFLLIIYLRYLRRRLSFCSIRFRSTRTTRFFVVALVQRSITAGRSISRRRQPSVCIYALGNLDAAFTHGISRPHLRTPFVSGLASQSRCITHRALPRGPISLVSSSVVPHRYHRPRTHRPLAQGHCATHPL
jgi:hypothetical protein